MGWVAPVAHDSTKKHRRIPRSRLDLRAYVKGIHGNTTPREKEGAIGPRYYISVTNSNARDFF